MQPTYVLVHGANGNSFCWAPLQRELALRGHRSLAVDLPGHGFDATFPVAYQAPQDAAALGTAPSGMAGRTLAQWVQHVVGVLRRVREHGPVVLLGHSRGGMTTTAVANAAPELIDRLVYLSAWCCVDSTVGEYMAGPEHAESELTKLDGVLAADPAALGAIRLNWRTADPAALAVLKEAMLADGTDDEFRAYQNLLEPDDSLDVGTGDDRARAGTWGTVAHSYLRLTRDRGLPLSLQDRFIREADALTPDNPFDVHSLDASHCGPLVWPAELATLLTGLPVGPAADR